MSASRITGVHARRVWDSRGLPTVEVEVALDGRAVGRAIAPAGASCGSREAIELRDGGAAFGGKGVARAIANVEARIAPALIGLDATDQAAVDARIEALDPGPAFVALGGNAVVATSLAVLHAAAAAAGDPLWRHLARSRGTRPSRRMRPHGSRRAPSEGSSP